MLMENMEVGKMAGLVYKHLAKNGKSSIPDLKNNIKADPEMLSWAIGWLVRENKICLSREAKAVEVWLTEDEMMSYKQREVERFT